ncbi:MAG: hypothetical protein JXA24_07530 [Proteobacteria bacterium]|nr:hypothetical protein [Pseudomonadota bacterium]
MRLDPETYWKTSLAVAWADRSNKAAAADAKLVREALSRPRHDLSGELRDERHVREAFDRIMQRARLASDWRAFNGRSSSPLFGRSPTLRGIAVDDISKPEPLLCRLSEAREAIERDLAMFEGTIPGSPSLTMLAMLSALEAAGKIPAGWTDKNRMQIVHAEIFKRSATLRRVVAENREDPVALVLGLAAQRAEISAEAREASVKTKDLGDYAIGTLVSAAIVAEPLLKDGQSARRLASSYDLYLRSPTLQATERSALADDRALMKFLLARRDRIAIECMNAMGKLKESAYTFPGASEHYSLHTLVEALYIAGRIEKTMAERLSRIAVGPLEYYLKNRDRLPELDEVARMGGDRTPNNAFDRARFTHSKDDSKLLSDDYIKRVFRWARWFYRDADIVTRSIYGADELPSLALQRRGIAPLGDLLPPDVKAEIMAAAQEAAHDPAAARKRAFRALDEMVSAKKMPGIRAQLSKPERQVIKLIERLVRWNSDALSAQPCGGRARRNTFPPAGLPGTSASFMPTPPVMMMPRILMNA